MYSRIDWSFINNVYVTETNIFINLISNQVITVPTRAFTNKEEQEIFLKYIDDHINTNSGLNID